MRLPPAWQWGRRLSRRRLRPHNPASHAQQCLDVSHYSLPRETKKPKQVKIARTYGVRGAHSISNFNEPAIGLPCMEDQKPDGTTQHIFWNIDIISGHGKNLDHISRQPTRKGNRRRGHFFSPQRLEHFKCYRRLENSPGTIFVPLVQCKSSTTFTVFKLSLEAYSDRG